MDETRFAITGRMKKAFRRLYHQRNLHQDWQEHLKMGQVSWGELKRLAAAISIDPHHLIQGARFQAAPSSSRLIKPSHPTEAAQWLHEQREYDRMVRRTMPAESLSQYRQEWKSISPTLSSILAIVYTLLASSLAAFYIARGLLGWSLEGSLMAALLGGLFCLLIDLFLFRRQFFPPSDCNKDG